MTADDFFSLPPSSRTKARLEAILQKHELQVRKRIALDHYWGHTFSVHTDYKHKFEKFIGSNNWRIDDLTKELE